MENKHTMADLYQMQSLPLESKIRMTEYRINQWIDEFGTDLVYVSFSGGKDSTVLLDIVRNRLGYKDIPAVFVDVPTQYPELREFAKTWDNLEIVKPKISFVEVCKKYGFPLISKEVAESVYGARKYLTEVSKELSIDRQTDRQTDRQLPYKYFYEKVTGSGKYSKFSDSLSSADAKAQIMSTRVGYDRKYRRVRGIGEFAKPTNEGQDWWEQSKTCNNARMAHERQTKSSSEEYP